MGAATKDSVWARKIAPVLAKLPSMRDPMARTPGGSYDRGWKFDPVLGKYVQKGDISLDPDPMGEPDSDGDDGYAKAFQQAFENGPARSGMLKPIDPFKPDIYQMGSVPDIHSAMQPGAQTSGAMKALLSAIKRPSLSFQGNLPGAELGAEMLPDSTSQLPALNIQSQPTGVKQGKMGRIGGALKRAILGR